MPSAPAALPACKSLSTAPNSCKVKDGTRTKECESSKFASVTATWPMSHTKMLPKQLQNVSKFGPRLAIFSRRNGAPRAESKRPKALNPARVCETRARFLLRILCRKCLRINVDRFALLERSCAALRRCKRPCRTASGPSFGNFDVVLKPMCRGSFFTPCGRPSTRWDNTLAIFCICCCLLAPFSCAGSDWSCFTPHLPGMSHLNIVGSGYARRQGQNQPTAG